MGKIAFIYPGQGSQFVGMGTDLVKKCPEAKQVFDEVKDVLGPSVVKTIAKGPKDELADTCVAQPAIITVSIAAHVCLLERGLRPDVVAGHSLGEYSALVAADVFDLSTALKIVRKRATLMAAAAELCDGSMAAVIGLDIDRVRELLHDVRDAGVIELANLNCPGQFVVSGEMKALDVFSARAKRAGAKRVIPLDVSGPFHSSLMKSAADIFSDYLCQFTPGEPQVPYVPNVTAEFLDESEDIPALLSMQIYRSVLWEDSVRRLIKFGCDKFIEVGPGKVLRGLVRRIDKNVDVMNVCDSESVDQAVAWAQSDKD